MELYDVMRTTPAVREFTADPVPDDVLLRILDNARFAPSGGNRQGAKVVVVRDRTTRATLAQLTIPGLQRYFAQLANGEDPWNPPAPERICALAPGTRQSDSCIRYSSDYSAPKAMAAESGCRCRPSVRR
jgi:nitroreductase